MEGRLEKGRLVKSVEEWYPGKAGHLLAEWLVGVPNGLGYLRERQWLRPTPAGLALVMPPCFRHNQHNQGS